MINSAVIFALMMNTCICYCKPVGIVAFGEVGGGKSTLCNTLVGSHDGSAFKEATNSEAQTMKTVGNVGKFGSWETFLIDTPGINDDNPLETNHLLDMAKYIRNNDEAQVFVLVLNFNSPRLGNRERQLFELVSSMYPKSKWYKHIGVVWSQYYPYFPPEMKNQRTNRVEGFKRFMSQYFNGSVPANEISSIPHYFVDSIAARIPNTESNKELTKLVSWAAKIPTLEQDLPQIKVPVRTYNNTRKTKLDKGTHVIQRRYQCGCFMPVDLCPVVEHEARTFALLTEEQTCTDYTDGSVQCSEWRLIKREREDVVDAEEYNLNGLLHKYKQHLHEHQSNRTASESASSNSSYGVIAESLFRFRIS